MWSACPETHRPWRPCRGRAGARPEGGSASSLLSMVVVRTADVLVQQAGLFRLARLPVLSIPKDRRDRAVRAGAQCQRSRAGSIQPLGVVARRQPKNADAGTEPLLGMRARAQDDLDQRRGVIADRLGFSQDPLVRPVVVAPVPGVAESVLGSRTAAVLLPEQRPLWSKTPTSARRAVWTEPCS